MAIQSEHETSPREDFCAIRVRMNSNPRVIYDSWTKGIDRWFAAPGSVHMDAKDGGEYSFETEHEGTRHPHHGKFLHLEKDRLVEMTWVTGEGGTEGAETVVSIEIAPEGTGSVVDLKHSGFPNEASMQRHEQAWVQVLGHQDRVLSKRGD
jgi:uncharacterized protein YndB with AHSA1/START domain